jgi:hypothetical protein
MRCGRRPAGRGWPGLRATAGALVVAALLAACATPSQPPAPISSAGRPAPAAGGGAAAGPATPPGAATRPAAPAPGPARPGPIADRPIDVDGRCAQTEEDGFREDATLLVRANEVRAMSWQLWVGRRGSCRFEHADFRQVRSRPHIELLARDGSGCKLMVWQDPRRITLAHAGCQRRCSGGIYDQAWPVMFDPRSGACARTDR